MATKAEKIVAGLGGIENIEEVEGCITRLRTEVVDAGKVDDAALKAHAAPTASSRWAPPSRSSSAPTPTRSPRKSKT